MIYEGIWNGFHVVNRIGYFLTEVPFDDKVITQVMIWDPEWDEIVDVDLEPELDK